MFFLLFFKSFFSFSFSLSSCSTFFSNLCAFSTASSFYDIR